MGHCDVTIAIGSGWPMFVNIQMIIPALCQSDCQTPDFQYQTRAQFIRGMSCAKKAPIATTPEQSVIVTSQLLAVGSSIDDVTIGQHFESFGAVAG